MTSFVHNFNANATYKSTSTSVSGAQYFLVIPYAYVPVDMIGFYFTENELYELPLTSECTHFKTTIRPVGYRLPFQTQASGTTFANSMTDIIGMYAYGLNNTYNGRNMKPNYNTTDPTDIDSLGEHRPLDQPYFPKAWTAGEVATPTKKPISSSIGNVIPLQNYFVATGIMEEGMAGEPLIMDSITTFDMMNKGNVNIVYEWPEVCILKQASAAMPFWKTVQDATTKAVTNPQIVLGKKFPLPTFLNAKFDVTPDAKKMSQYVFPDFKIWGTYVQPGLDVNVFDMHIEMAGLCSRGIGELSSAFLPPTLHIGGLPTRRCTYSQYW